MKQNMINKLDHINDTNIILIEMKQMIAWKKKTDNRTKGLNTHKDRNKQAIIPTLMRK